MVQYLELNTFARPNSTGRKAKRFPTRHQRVNITRLQHGEKPGSKVECPRKKNESIWLPHCTCLPFIERSLDMLRTGIPFEDNQCAHVLILARGNTGWRRADSPDG